MLRVFLSSSSIILFFMQVIFHWIIPLHLANITNYCPHIKKSLLSFRFARSFSLCLSLFRYIFLFQFFVSTKIRNTVVKLLEKKPCWKKMHLNSNDWNRNQSNWSLNGSLVFHYFRLFCVLVIILFFSFIFIGSAFFTCFLFSLLPKKARAFYNNSACIHKSLNSLLSFRRCYRYTMCDTVRHA